MVPATEPALGHGKGIIITSHFATGKVAISKDEMDRSLAGVDLGAVHGVGLGQIRKFKPIKGHGGNLVAQSMVVQMIIVS